MCSTKDRDTGYDAFNFDQRSLKEFGLYDYASFKMIEDRNRTFDEESVEEDAKHTEIELL